MDTVRTGTKLSAEAWVALVGFCVYMWAFVVWEVVSFNREASVHYVLHQRVMAGKFYPFSDFHCNAPGEVRYGALCHEELPR